MSTKKGMNFGRALGIMMSLLLSASFAWSAETGVNLKVENVDYVYGSGADYVDVVIKMANDQTFRFSQFALDLTDAPAGLFTFTGEDGTDYFPGAIFADIEDLGVFNGLSDFGAINLTYVATNPEKTPYPVSPNFHEYVTIRLGVNKNLITDDLQFNIGLLPMQQNGKDGWAKDDNGKSVFSSPKLADINVTNAKFTVVKLFNALPASEEVALREQDKIESGSGVFEFTDVGGKPVNGTLVSIDSITISSEELESIPSGSEQGGTFSIDSTGTKIIWDNISNLRYYAPHDNVTAVIGFTAKDSQGRTDSSTYTVTLINQDMPPRVNGFTVLNAIEGDYLKFTMDAKDPNWDALILPTTVKIVTYKSEAENSEVEYTEEIDGTWSGNEFKSSERLSYDCVNHLNSCNESAPWDLILTVSSKYQETVQSTDVIWKFSSAEDYLVDYDRYPLMPGDVEITYEGGYAYATTPLSISHGLSEDPDGDEVSYKYRWYIINEYGDEKLLDYTTKDLPAGTFKKGDYLEVAVAAVSTNRVSNWDRSAGVTIANSKPVAQDAGIFILKKEGESAVKTLSLTELNAYDADGDVLTFIPYDQNGTPQSLPYATSKGIISKDESNNLVYTVTSEEEFFGSDVDIIYFRIEDIEGAASDVHTLSVSYQSNPQPEIVAGSVSTAPEFINEDGEKVTFSLKLADGSLAGAPAASGVKSYSVKAAIGASDISSALTDIEFTPSEGTEAAELSFNFKPDYALLNGSARPAQATVVISVKATDGDNVESSWYDAWSFPLNDVDRKAAAPTAITTLPELPWTTGSNLTFTPAGAEDPDGDSILGYKVVVETKFDGKTDSYIFETVNGIAETSSDSSFKLKKGDVVTWYAYAITKRVDGGEELEGEHLAGGPVTVQNTAPTISDTAYFNCAESSDGKTSYQENIGIGAGSYFITAADEDYACGRDTLTFSILDKSALEGIADVEITESGDALKIVPVQYANTGNENPFISVAVTDGSGSQAICQVYFTIEPVNQPPIIFAKNSYVLPSEQGLEKEMELDVAMGGGEDEKVQTLSNAQVDVVSSPEGFFMQNPIATAINEGTERKIQLTYIVSEAAELGQEATLKITVQDSGTPSGTSEPVYVKVILGATPWFPVYTVQSPAEKDYAMVRIFNKEAEIDFSMVIEKDANNELVVKPADYLRNIIQVWGLLGGFTYEVEVYDWTVSGGTGDKWDGTFEPITVQDYGLPPEPVINVNFNDGIAKIKVDTTLASGFAIVVDGRPGAQLYYVSYEYLANEDGMIIPDTMEYEVEVEDGDYKVYGYAINPMGMSKQSEPVCFTSQSGKESQINAEKWLGGEFFPADGSDFFYANQVERGSVLFSWPADLAADYYRFELCFSDGSVEYVKELHDNQLFLLDLEGCYRWKVYAVRGVQEVVSPIFTFSICSKSETPVIIDVNSVAGDESKLLLSVKELTADETLVYEVMYFNVSTGKWAYIECQAVLDGEHYVIDDSRLTIYPDLYVMIRVKGSGEDYKICKIKPMSYTR